MTILVVGRTWDGHLLPPDARTSLRLGWAGDDLRIEVDAPYSGDPPPPGPPGPLEGLWEHEVVELFVLGPGDRYTEIELGPHGHHLVLQLEGVRNAVARALPIAFAARLEGARWRGEATIGRAWLPERPIRCNAYRIHGAASLRRYEAMVAVPGDRPDFHRPDRFAPWPL